MHSLISMNKFKSHFLLTLVLLQLGLPSSQAKVPQFGELTNSSTVRFGRAASPSPLSSKALRLLVWNIHKGLDENLPKDFANISYAADLTLLQEAVSEKSLPQSYPRQIQHLVGLWQFLSNFLKITILEWLPDPKLRLCEKKQ